MSRLYVGITGSREGHPKVRALMQRFVRSCGTPDLWVLGGARGVDAEAEQVCREEGWPHAVLYAEWNRYGRYLAGRQRNHDMVAMVKTAEWGVFLAFPQPTSRGTWHCVNAARRAGLSVHVIEPPDEYELRGKYWVRVRETKT